MSRDSNYTYVHMHSSHHADLFEDFCPPPSSNTTSTSTSNSNANHHTTTNDPNSSADPTMAYVPGSFLPYEEIQLPAHLMPLNPEDEDDVVPDMHAAFGIQRALGQGAGDAEGRGVAREPAWRDLGMERLLESGGAARNGSGKAAVGAGSGGRKEGKKTSILLMR